VPGKRIEVARAVGALAGAVVAVAVAALAAMADGERGQR
jgi:hypothetical protein